MRVLVTGGGGFLGSRIARQLLRRGDQVRVFGRHPYPAVAALGAETFQGDVADPVAVAAACAGCDVVVHTAAKAGIWGDPREYRRINVDGTRNVLEACLQARVPRLVHTSSPSVVFGGAPIAGGDETLPYPPRHLAAYAATKAEAERLVLAANGRDLPGGGTFRACALRPHLIWGEEDPHIVPRLLELARRGRLRQIGDGTNRVDLTHVENAAAAHLLAADALHGTAAPAAGRAYFISDGEPVLLWPWIRELLALAGLRLPARPVPYRLAYAAGALLEALHRAVPALGEPPMTRFVASQFALSHWFSLAAARRDLRYAPVLPPAAGMARLAAWLHDAGLAAPPSPSSKA